jgi:hypothetical protein
MQQQPQPGTVSRSELDGYLRIFSEDALDPFRRQMAAVYAWEWCSLLGINQPIYLTWNISTRDL